MTLTSGHLAHGDGTDIESYPEFVIGTFTGDGTTQTITMGNPSSYWEPAAAVQVQAIPEPASIVLFGLTGLLLLKRRR